MCQELVARLQLEVLEPQLLLEPEEMRNLVVEVAAVLPVLLLAVPEGVQYMVQVLAVEEVVAMPPLP